jgi:hypothetical protein
MKFCYLDETGTGTEPFALIIGILVDAYRMKPTKKGWDEKFTYLTDDLGLEIEELHAKDLFKNRKAWRITTGEQKTEFVNELVDWFVGRGHQLVYACVNIDLYHEQETTNEKLKDMGSLWRFLAMHIILSVQKSMQSKLNNKGNTVFIFDKKDLDEIYFTDLIISPPKWTESYYKKKKKDEALNQIIDIPHFVDSRHVGLIQLADLFAYIFRRDIEIKEKLSNEEFKGEAELMNTWVTKLRSTSIPKRFLYPTRGLCETATLINSLAPTSIK